MNHFLQNLSFPKKHSFFLIAGPCVIEDYDTTCQVAQSLAEITHRLKIPFIFKASFDKANRTAFDAFRGPGMDEGLEILNKIKQKFNLKVISDIHLPDQAQKAAEILDFIQIPAFLCRQTDLILAAARTGRPVNIKKGQFLAPWDCKNIIEKAKSAGCRQVSITERGTSFGYNNLVVDFRGIEIIQAMEVPVIFDATHSVQLPGGKGTASAGERKFAPTLARAAMAAGADGLFIETHPNPDKALCDGPNSIPLQEMEALLTSLIKIKAAL
ncbi:2-dehydro-3-deoxyphosphooctonate aldolase (KDO 8-P synthase) [Desulfocicer vacuolatum DSM 3385]|uniref:2-dehydro-3-deoxyphosphooctonate aldolase n=1 Tax=Desulfocicer vacuolatum DSM 3385 TaxID=1121400 RepID=A0A1W2CG05_9BACT|nr:3-deoxy-8-phosphooctulonate synthase [Desulfocicer vacuolatum]SMC83588.1 2-dehydro-3-deoxyphosphooctonate aldolase (KDO 8-P synthase) [Desulfocicer vacuolatum DSM 3385]